MLIAVDAVGGDHFPERPVQGALEAVKQNNDLQVLLIGPQDMIQKELNRNEYDSDRIRILDAPEIIGMNESPAAAVKQKRNSSINIGLSLHKKGDCSAFVSAGNTGALLAASTLLLGKLDGVIRPTIAATFPTIKGISLLVDAGANIELKPAMYVQFAKMCTIFSKEILDVTNPLVGLLNIGEEEEKGTDVHKEVYKLLSTLPNFFGNIEGSDILFGKTDIFLTDGFTGNVILKFGESIPEILFHMLKKTMNAENVSQDSQNFVFSMIEKTMNTFNYEHIGGIPFLGINGLSLVGHGGSSVTAIKNMILNAVRCVEYEINEKIVESLKS